MPGLLSGLVNAGTAAATGYAQGEAANLRALLAERARRAQAQREAEELELRRIAALGTAAGQGLTLTPAASPSASPPISRRTAIGAAPVSPEGGREAASVTGPTVPPDAAAPVPAPEGPPPAAEEGTPIGEIAGVRIAIPPAGLQSRGAREAEAKAQQTVQDRRARLEAHNATLPPGDKRRMAPSLIGLLAGNEQLYSKWAEQAAGLGAPDPTAVHRANRDYDVAHPTPARARAEPAPKLTDTQRQTAGLLPEITDAHTRLGTATPDFISQHMGRLPIVGNYAKTDQGRQFEQTANQFITNIVYAKSGKGVTDAEFKRLWDTYIPSPGDDETALQQKATARARAIEGLQAASSAPAPPPANAPGAPRVTPTTTRSAGAPPARTVTRPSTSSTTSDADLWESLVNGGMTPEQATRAVQNRRRP